MITHLIVAAIMGGALLLFGLFLWVVIDVLVLSVKQGRLS